MDDHSTNIGRMRGNEHLLFSFELVRSRSVQQINVGFIDDTQLILQDFLNLLRIDSDLFTRDGDSNGCPLRRTICFVGSFDGKHSIVHSRQVQSLTQLDTEQFVGMQLGQSIHVDHALLWPLRGNESLASLQLHPSNCENGRHIMA